MKKILSALVLACTVGLTACNDADVVSSNISKAADNFEVQRRVVFYNGITGEYLLEIQGLCSIGNDRTQSEVSITCKVGPGQQDYKKHYLGISDNVTWFAEQIKAVEADPYHYRVIFKPSVIVPDIEVK